MQLPGRAGTTTTAFNPIRRHLALRLIIKSNGIGAAYGGCRASDCNPLRPHQGSSRRCAGRKAGWCGCWRDWPWRRPFSKVEAEAAELLERAKNADLALSCRKRPI